jgi:hypothetical protein
MNSVHEKLTDFRFDREGLQDQVLARFCPPIAAVADSEMAAVRHLAYVGD